MSGTQAREALDLDALIARIRAEAGTEPDPAAPAATAGGAGPPPLAWTEVEAAAAAPETLRTLLACPQEAFVRRAYRALLGREPDPEGARIYGAKLARGTSRSFVLARMLWSAEGRETGARLSGLGWAKALRSLPGKRLLRPVFGVWDRLLRWGPGATAQGPLAVRVQAAFEATHRTLSAALRERDARLISLGQAVPGLEAQLQQALARIDTLEADRERLEDERQQQREALDTLEQQLRQSLAEPLERLQVRIDALDTGLARLREDHAERSRAFASEQRRQRQELDFSRSDLLRHRTQLNDLLRALLNGAVTPAAVPPAPAAGASSSELDAYYLAFEDLFRGDSVDIEAGLQHYLDAIAVSDRTPSGAPVLDLGCGRGEWLALLQRSGYHVRGVDSNPLMVEHCRERGLEAMHGDALALLQREPAEHLAVLSAFHLIEHLPFDVLYRLLEQAHRVLAPGGLLLLETPNPENVLVGSHTFYHDPTHRNPVTPAAIGFLVRYLGFAEPEIRRLHPYPPEARVPGEDPLTERVNGHLCGPQDYAVIARKPAAVP